MICRACVVTGANSGIGKEIARGLAAQGSRVIMVARNREKGEAARAEVSDSTNNEGVELVICDLSSQRQVRELASTILERCDRLHVLVNNAGLILKERVLTEDGMETAFAVNHLAPFLLTNLLRRRLEASAPSRIVAVSSGAHRGTEFDFDDPNANHGYEPWDVYSKSKLANVLFTRELARRLRGTGVTATCFHPGVVRTGFGRQGPPSLMFGTWIGRLLLLSPKDGADTGVWLASSSEVEGASGGYYEKRRLVDPSPAACDPDASARLWELSERLTGLDIG